MANPEPDNWESIVNLSTINYFVAFLPDYVTEERISKMPGYYFERPKWMDNYQQYGPYACINVEDEPWDEVVSKFRKEAKLDKTTGTGACILYDSTNNAFLMEFDE
jgi:hypothetical protein